MPPALQQRGERPRPHVPRSKAFRTGREGGGQQEASLPGPGVLPKARAGLLQLQVLG